MLWTQKKAISRAYTSGTYDEADIASFDPFGKTIGIFPQILW